MTTRRLLFLFCILSSLAPAMGRADERPGPLALIDRPLVLPHGFAEVTDEVSAAVLPSYPDAHGFTEKLSFDVGIGHRVQLGAWTALPLVAYSPSLGFSGSIVPHVTIDLRRNLALRIETGLDRIADPTSTSHAFVAFTLVARWRLHPMVTVFFGDTGERSEAPTTLVQHGNASSRWYDSVGSLPGMSQALFALEADRHGVVGSFGAPFGVLVQPHARVALHFTTGVRWQFDSQRFDRTAEVPLTLDVVVTPARHVDLGASVSAPLLLDGSGVTPVPLVQTSLFVRARF